MVLSIAPSCACTTVCHFSQSTQILSCQCNWTPWVDDAIVWPSPPLPFHISDECRVNVLLPHLYMPSPDLSPTLSWYMTDLQGEWPSTPVGVPSIAFLDTPIPLRTKGIYDGVPYWEMSYGYPEHLRFVTCIYNGRNRTFVSQSEVMFRIFKSMFESLAVPYTIRLRDYRMTLQQVSTWTVEWL